MTFAAPILPAAFPPAFAEKLYNTQSIPAAFRLRQAKNLLAKLDTPNITALSGLSNI